MKIQRFNWPIWAGFLLSLLTLLSYPFIFVRWPVTRDFPWANLLLLGIAAVLLLIGVRRASAPGRRRLTKIGTLILATLSVMVLSFFVFAFFIASRWLPAFSGRSASRTEGARFYSHRYEQQAGVAI